MRLLLAGLFLTTTVLAQPASRVDEWRSPHNRKRLRIEWEVLPDRSPIKLPDGTTEARKAPWPMLFFVVQNRDSKGYKKISEKILFDTRFALATHAVRVIKIKPSKAIDLDFLAGQRGIKDPSFVLVDREYKVLGAITSPKDFNDRKMLALLDKAVKEEYDTSLGAYCKAWVKLLQQEEKLHKTEKKIEKLQEKAAKKDKAASAKLDKEADAMEARLNEDREALEPKFLELRNSLTPRGEAKAEIPTTVGKGKGRRKLTPEEIEAIKTYREFARDPNPIVRAAAVEDLGQMDSAPMVAEILKAANDVDPRIVEAAGKALGRMKKPESLEAMTSGLAHANSKARRAALLGFANSSVQHAPATPGLLELVQSPDAELRQAAVRAIANQKAMDGVPSLVTALDDSVPAIRVLAAQALGELRAKDGAAALIKRLDASDWSLQKAAIEALASIRVKESIEPLLVKFENDEGLVVESVYKALVAITGQDYKYRTVLWRKWWDRAKGSFQVPSDTDIAKAKAKAAKALEGYAKPKRKYHRIETLSKKMIFILDISTSMRDKIVIPPSAPEEVHQEFPDRVKMEIAKNELLALLASLDKNVYFNIITFAGRVKTWRDGLISGTSKNAAIKFVRRLKPIAPASGKSSGEEQKTNTYAALMEAFGMADKKVPDWKARTKVDTIFLVTDGLPTTGEIVDVRKLVIAVNEINRTRGIVIHVVCFDKEALRRLRPLAEASGGQAVLRGYAGKN
ncbi:MAG: HEAT repeat domain-containing protein [Planctomycetota bacterium]|jgi:HEAT repeat protein